MQYRPVSLVLVAVICILLMTAGCTETPTTKPATTVPPTQKAVQETATSTPVPDGTLVADTAKARAAFLKGESEFKLGNYRAAAQAFGEASSLWSNASDTANALKARNRRFNSERILWEYPLNISAARAALKEKVPGISEENITRWLDIDPQKIVSDNETLYFEDIAGDYFYAHPLEMQKYPQSVNFSYIARYALAGTKAGAMSPYVNPVNYSGYETLAIPGKYLPKSGVLKIWFPLPVETDSQRNISVTNLSSKERIVKGPVTQGDIGYVYYEIPADTVHGDLQISFNLSYTSFGRVFAIDPGKVGAYNTSDPEYQLYTKSSPGIEITDAIRRKAKEIVGNETNPHLQAQKLYRYIIGTYPYSHVPHGALQARDPPVEESTYMFATGHGDCGTQSTLFSAFCRSLGIPARTIGGYQMIIAPTSGSHFWSEYYLAGYGWIPNDLTLADVADWVKLSEGERSTFKDYYATNLDPARLVIQKDVGVEMDPELPRDAPVYRLVRQMPAIVSDTAQEDLDAIANGYFTLSLSEIHQK